MGGAANRLTRRRKAQRILIDIFEQPNTANAVHYSCESFHEKIAGDSPRITSIAVHNLGSRQTQSFSIHLVAERQRATVKAEEIDEDYDPLERTMLDEFYEFLRAHRNDRWLHWNMDDNTYGFPAIAHRYQVLGGDPVPMSDPQLHDLSSILISIYGPKYIGHRRLTNIMQKNEITNRFFLDGAEESEAFKNREYVRLHRSTLRKVQVIHAIAERSWDGSLRTDATWWQQHGTSLLGFVDGVTDHPTYKILGAIGIIVGIPASIFTFF